MTQDAEGRLTIDSGFLEQLIEAIPAPLFYKNAEGRYLGCNEAFCRYLGLQRDQILGKTVFEVSPPDLARQYFEADQKLLRSAGSQLYETQVSYADGTRREVVFHKATIQGTSGVVGIVGVILDVTERRRAEEGVRHERDRAQMLLDIAPAVFIGLDRAGKVTMLNRRGSELTGWAPAEAIGKDWFDSFLPESDREARRADFQQAIAGVPPRSPGDRILTSDGRTLNLAWRSVLLRDGQGGVTGILSSGVDVTDRIVLAETHSTILRTTTDGFWIADMHGRFLEVNDAYCALIGYDREELLEMRIADIEAVETPEDVARRVDGVMQKGADRFQTQHRRKDGALVDVEITVNYVQAGEGWMVVFLRDISERVRTEREREALIQELQDALAKVRLLSGMLPICVACKKIRDDKGYWTRIEKYVSERSEANFTHGICPECEARLYPDDPREDP